MVDDKYLHILRKYFPSVEQNQIQSFNEGWDYLILVVNNEMVFRFPRREDYAKKLPIEVDFLKSFAHKSSVSVPELKLHVDNKMGVYATYTFISGVQFSSEIAASFNRENLLGVAKELGNFLTILHSFPVAKAKQIGIQELNPIAEWEKGLEEIKRRVFPNINTTEQEWITQLYEKFLNNIRGNPFKVIVSHGDIMSIHIIVDPDKQSLSGIIDFGDIEIADPAFDFGFLDIYGHGFLAEVYINYKLPRDEHFDLRRKFYRDRLVIGQLKHFLEIKDAKMITEYKNRLTDYINKNP